MGSGTHTAEASLGMPRDPRSDQIRRATARRFERNVIAMLDASDKEFGQAEDLIGDGILRILTAVVLLLIGAVLASGWAVWAQALAIGALAVVVVGALLAWRAFAPPAPPDPEPEPPLVSVTPRKRSRRARR